MESLKAAVGRLDRTVGRLERAAGAREHRFGTRERELVAQLNAAQVEQARATANTEDMSRRLEAAIGRLEAVMES